MPKVHAKLRTLIEGKEPVLAPLVLNPLMAKMAERAGFKALYLGGGGMGYLTCMTEANLTLTEMSETALGIRTISTVPLILDAASGWGDPMHIHRTMGMAEAAGFEAIEIEDQILPKRAHHHIGVEHIVPMQLMVDKIKEAVATRRSRDMVIIARTNASRTDSLDEALRRGDAFIEAGADMLFVPGTTPDETRIIADRLKAPHMMMIRPNGKGATGLAIPEMRDMGYRLFVDPASPLLAMHHAMAMSYAAIMAGKPDPTIGADFQTEHHHVHDTIELDTLLEVERRTVEK